LEKSGFLRFVDFTRNIEKGCQGNFYELFKKGVDHANLSFMQDSRTNHAVGAVRVGFASTGITVGGEVRHHPYSI
jgi:hypothetical protein